MRGVQGIEGTKPILSQCFCKMKKEKKLSDPKALERVEGGRSGQLLTNSFLAQEFLTQTPPKPRGDFTQVRKNNLFWG